MTTLSILVAEFGANAFVFCDAGNGCGFGEHGQMIDYDRASAERYGAIELAPLTEAITSEDGTACAFSSDWQDDANGYRWRVMF